jgi:hypothetical protein
MRWCIAGLGGKQMNLSTKKKAKNGERKGRYEVEKESKPLSTAIGLCKHRIPSDLRS